MLAQTLHTLQKILFALIIVLLIACASRPVLETTIKASTADSNFSDAKVISPDTAINVTQLTRYGMGYLTGAYAWAQDVPYLAIVSTAGISIYDAAAQREIRFVETPSVIAAVALSPDGKILTAVGRDSALILWDVPTGRLLNTLQVTVASPFEANLVFSPDGQRLAFIDGKSIHIWDLTTSRELQAWPAQDISQLAFVNDQILAVRGYFPAVLGFWDVTRGQMLTKLNTVATWTLTSDKVVLTAAAYDTTIELQEVGTNQSKHTLQGSVKPAALGLALSPDGKTLAVGDWKTIEIWDVSTGRQLHRIENLSIPCCLFYRLLFSPDGQLLALSAEDAIWLWDVATGGRELHQTLPGPGYATRFAFAADRQTLVVIYSVETGPHTSKYVIKLLAVPAGQELAVFDAGFRSLFVGVAPRSPALVAYGVRNKPGQNSKILPVVDFNTGRELSQLLEGSPLAVLGNRLVAIKIGSDYSQSYVDLWNVTSGHQLHHPEQAVTSGTNVEFSPDGQWLALPSREGDNSPRDVVQIWSVATDQREVSLPIDSVSARDFTPDSNLLATAKLNGDIVFWDVTTGAVTHTLHTSIAYVSALAFSPDGRVLAVADSATHVIHLWDIAADQELTTFAGHLDKVNTVAFSPDGQLLASASDDHTLKLWRIAPDRELKTLVGHNDRVDKVIFSADGKYLASSSYDGTVRVWGVP